MPYSPIPDFATSPLTTPSTKAWNIASILAIGVAIFICTNILALHGFGATAWGLFSAALALCLFGLIHARFLSVAQSQSLETRTLLATKKRQFQCVFDNALNAILVFDSNGICQDASPSCSRLLGSRRDEIVGRSIRLFYANPREFDSLWERLRADDGFRQDAELVRTDGLTVFAEFTVAKHFLPNRHLMILRDISERCRTQQALGRCLVRARSFSQESDALRRATLALAGDLRMDRVLGTLLETLARFVPYEQAQVFLLESDERLFLAHEIAADVSAAELGFPETVELDEFPIVAAVLERREGIILDDASEMNQWRHRGKGSPVRSWMGVPINSSSQALGVLLLAHSSPAVFSDDHRRLSRSLADSTAVAIQSSRLYERAEIYALELEGRTSEARDTFPSKSREETARQRAVSENLFEKVFRSAPVAMSVTSLPAGRFIEVNKAFERSFGLKSKDVCTRSLEEIQFWEDPGEWNELIERLERGTKVRREVARLKSNSGNYERMRYSAERIDIDGQACLLLVVEGTSD
jgi:PAS domain S-box-containing protein